MKNKEITNSSSLNTQGMHSIAGAGDPRLRNGLSILVYSCNTSMQNWWVWEGGECGVEINFFSFNFKVLMIVLFYKNFYDLFFSQFFPEFRWKLFDWFEKLFLFAQS